jgi:hypothetical protein
MYICIYINICINITYILHILHIYSHTFKYVHFYICIYICVCANECINMYNACTFTYIFIQTNKIQTILLNVSFSACRVRTSCDRYFRLQRCPHKTFHSKEGPQDKRLIGTYPLKFHFSLCLMIPCILIRVINKHRLYPCLA